MGSLSRSLEQWQMRPGRGPFEDESLYGYIAHRTAEERLPTIFFVTSLAGIEHMQSARLAFGDSDLTNVADCLRIDASQLEGRTYPVLPNKLFRLFFGAPILRYAIDFKLRRFSPTALRSAPYHRAIWSLRPLPFCCETGEFLQDKCPHCGKVQKWHHANGVDRCDFCVQSLIDAKPIAVPAQLLSRLRSAAALIDPRLALRERPLSALPAEIRAMGPGPAFDLLTIIAGVVDPALRMQRRAALRHNADPLRICEAMATAWDLLAGWPEKFEMLAATRLAGRTTRFSDGNSGATVDMLSLANRDWGVSPVPATILALRNRFINNRQSAFDVPEAAAATGLLPEWIIKVRRSGILKPVFHLGRYPLPLLSKSDVEDLGARFQSSINAHKAAFTLGITYYGVEQLIVLGHLSTIVPAWATDDPNHLLCGKSWSALIRSLTNQSSPPSRGEWTALKDVLTGIPGPKAWGPILAMLSRAELPSYALEGTKPLIDRLFIRKEDIPTFRGISFSRDNHPDFSFCPVMSKSEATLALNLHRRHAIPLLAKWPTKLGGERTVPIQWVEKIAAQFVSPAELAYRLQIGPCKAFAEAEKAGIDRKSPAGFDRQAIDRHFGR